MSESSRASAQCHVPTSSNAIGQRDVHRGRAATLQQRQSIQQHAHRLRVQCAARWGGWAGTALGVAEVDTQELPTSASITEASTAQLQQLRSTAAERDASQRSRFARENGAPEGMANRSPADLVAAVLRESNKRNATDFEIHRGLQPHSAAAVEVEADKNQAVEQDGSTRAAANGARVRTSAGVLNTSQKGSAQSRESDGSASSNGADVGVTTIPPSSARGARNDGHRASISNGVATAQRQRSQAAASGATTAGNAVPSSRHFSGHGASVVSRAEHSKGSSRYHGQLHDTFIGQSAAADHSWGLASAWHVAHATAGHAAEIGDSVTNTDGHTRNRQGGADVDSLHSDDPDAAWDRSTDANVSSADAAAASEWAAQQRALHASLQRVCAQPAAARAKPMPLASVSGIRNTGGHNRTSSQDSASGRRGQRVAYDGARGFERHIFKQHSEFDRDGAAQVRKEAGVGVASDSDVDDAASSASSVAEQSWHAAERSWLAPPPTPSVGSAEEGLAGRGWHFDDDEFDALLSAEVAQRRGGNAAGRSDAADAWRSDDDADSSSRIVVSSHVKEADAAVPPAAAPAAAHAPVRQQRCDQEASSAQNGSQPAHLPALHRGIATQTGGTSTGGANAAQRSGSSRDVSFNAQAAAQQLDELPRSKSTSRDAEQVRS